MRKSEPKPKIIYKNISDLIRSSSLTSKSIANALKTEVSLQDKCEHLERNNRLTASSKSTKLNKSRSRHSLESKEKFNVSQSNQKHKKITEKRSENISIDIYFKQIEKMYGEMEHFFANSKQKLVKQITFKMQQDPSSVEIDSQISQLQKMADYIKHVVNFYAHQEGFSKQKSNLKTQMSRIPHHVVALSQKDNNINVKTYEPQDSIFTALVLKNSKQRANMRKQAVNNRKKTIYETILSEKQEKLKKKQVR